jgi:soluble lytic murein transglycosylase-like protein
MGQAKDALTEFIDSIPAAKLTGIPTTATSAVYKTKHFRMDMQGPTTAKKGQGKRYNLQIQVNRETAITTLKKLAPKTVAKSLPPMEEAKDWTAEEIRKDLKKNMMI